LHFLSNILQSAVRQSNEFSHERQSQPTTSPVTPEEQAHFRVLQAIERNPDVTQRELAEQLGISLGKTNFLINALLDKGAIKMENFRRSDTKLKKIAYLLTPSGIAERLRLTQGYLAAKRAEYQNLKAEIKALEQEESLSTKANKA
jgi:EPS-associated MarR family transcriptional regulator